MKRIIVAILIFFIFSCLDLYAKKIELMFWHSLGFHVKKIVEDMTAEYNRTNPGVEVKPIFQGSFEEMQVKMLASAVTRKLPDIAQVQIEYLDSYIQNRLLEPINDIMPKGEREDILEILWKLVSRQGLIYGVPMCISTEVFFYNENSFLKAGLDPEKPPCTWEEMVQMGMKLTRDTNRDGVPDIYGVMFWLNGIYGIAPLLWANGGELLSEDGSSVALTTPQMKETISMVRDLVFTYRIMPRKWTDWEGGQAFLTGKLAMGWFSCSAITYGEENFPWKLRVTLMPEIKGKRFSTLGGSALVCFSPTSSKRKASYDFMFWLTNRENTIKMHRNIGYIPVRKSALNSLELKAFHKSNPNYRVPIQAMEYGRPLPNHPEFFKINKELREMLQRIILEDSDPVRELERTERKINELLS